jgi:hypothetical protein
VSNYSLQYYNGGHYPIPQTAMVVLMEIIKLITTIIRSKGIFKSKTHLIKLEGIFFIWFFYNTFYNHKQAFILLILTFELNVIPYIKKIQFLFSLSRSSTLVFHPQFTFVATVPLAERPGVNFIHVLWAAFAPSRFKYNSLA